MGGDRLALLPKGRARKPGKKLLCGAGKRKASTSWVSDFRGQSWSGPCSSLGNPIGITKPSSANCTCRGSQNAACWGFPARRLLSDVCDPSKKPSMVWVGGSDSHTYSSMGWPWSWGGLQQTLGKINNGTARPTALENRGFAWDVHLQTCPLDTSWVLFIPISSVEEHILTAHIIKIS